MGFITKNRWKVFQYNLKAIQMGYNLPKHTLHDNVSDKETSRGDSKHHVYSG